MSAMVENSVSFCNGIDRASSDESDDGVISEQHDWDTFGLEFAASQWLKLVINAEHLFSRLISNTSLAVEDKNQIEQWLCLKQECEECVIHDGSVSGRDCGARVLERIDELTEFDEQTDRSLEAETNNIHYQNGNFDPDTESDSDSQHPEFVDRLTYFMDKFKNATDERVKKLNYMFIKTGDNCHVNQWYNDESEKYCENRINCIEDTNHNLLQKRRMSIFPRTAVLDINVEQTLSDDCEHVDFNLNPVKEECDWEEDNIYDRCKSVSCSDMAAAVVACEDAAAPYEELRILAAGNEMKQSQMRKVLIDLEEAHKRIEELHKTIEIKEQFIADMIKNSDMRSSAKHRFQKKRKKLEEGYYKTRSQLAQSENALILLSKNGFSDEFLKHKKEIEKHKSVAVQYKKRLMDIEMMKQIASESAKKILELENSLLLSKRQMERLEKQLKKEEKQKEVLEKELLQDQTKIKELEQKYKLQLSKLNKMEQQKDRDDIRLQWIFEEEKRLANMQESSQKFKEQLIEHQTLLEKREALFKEKLCVEKNKVRYLSDVSSKPSLMEQMSKENSDSIQKQNGDEKEALRIEIRNLRKTRECLVEQRCHYDKLKKENKLSALEERKLLEHDEAIEAIDATIEYKNEMICGRKSHDLDYSQVPREKDEELLISHLMKLSTVEMRSLLHKYFLKVIDLKESGKKMEIQLAEVDAQNDSLKWKIHELTNSLYQSHLEAERHIVLLEKDYQEKLHLMLRHCAEESSGSSGPEGNAIREKNMEISQCRQENKMLKRRICQLEALLQVSGKPHAAGQLESPAAAIPQKNLKQLQGPSPSPTTKVTRKKNKLIIQQEKYREGS
ncbi:kinesin-like protein costa [Schistocerca serialis cubense]|uniref:kinesin-like protein costa n=1 Tax=Schistocerca serialis cubense TaxID=2023355 RepID=UPI00214E8B91|nr:kinesin-like protein costa [Schistocerca serialis cubense]